MSEIIQNRSPKKVGQKEIEKAMKYLVAFDFDMTVIDDDSDHYILKILAPELLDQVRQASKEGRQWTDLCDWSVGELHKRGFQPSQMNCALRGVPFNAKMKNVFECLHQKGHDILIISDANTIYIDEISHEKGIKGFITNVITNPAKYNQDGRLEIKRHTTSQDAHSCSRCPPNLCKGRELGKYIDSKLPLKYDRILYFGDGGNDFCPSSKLSESDVCFPRKGYKFHQMLQDEKFKGLIMASVVEWDHADDILLELDKILP